jgi:hypothetical protein
MDQPPPAELQDALQQGLAAYSRLSASAASPLMAVAKGAGVALVDLTSHAAEMAAGSIAAAAAAPGGGGGGGGSAGQTTLVRHNARFHVLGLALDPACARHLAVAGLRDLELWVLEGKGQVADRLVLGLPFDASERGPLDVVSRVEWLPGSDTWLAVRGRLACLSSPAFDAGPCRCSARCGGASVQCRQCRRGGAEANPGRPCRCRLLPPPCCRSRQVTTPCCVALYDVAHCVARPTLLLSLPRGDLVRGCAFAQRLAGGPAAAGAPAAAAAAAAALQEQRTVAFLLSSGSTVHAVELPPLQRLGGCAAACGLGPHQGREGPSPEQLSLQAPQLALPYDMGALQGSSSISFSPASGLLQLAVSAAA